MFGPEDRLKSQDTARAQPLRLLVGVGRKYEWRQEPCMDHGLAWMMPWPCRRPPSAVHSRYSYSTEGPSALSHTTRSGN